ncbi:MAG TPA: peptidylprolyl isomerase [Planctomycetota bacterium]|nr:peptidylprolyl isomerase [Planctomycetota bacterium]
MIRTLDRIGVLALAMGLLLVSAGCEPSGEKTNEPASATKPSGETDGAETKPSTPQSAEDRLTPSAETPKPPEGSASSETSAPSEGVAATPKPKEEEKPRVEPERITLQHILIAFRGTGTAATRSKTEAETLANDILARAKEGEDFGELMREHSDDPGPGIYGLTNTGVAPRSPQEYPRQGMVPAFGNVGFGLEVGEIGVAPHDPATSPYGWHIIKRLK